MHQFIRTRLIRWLRLLAFVAIIVGASAWWQVRRASARLTELSSSVGGQLSKMQEVANGTSTLKINGQRVSLTTLTTDASVTDVLDRFTASCMKSTGGLAEELRELEANGAKVPADFPRHALGVLRMEKNEEEASAGCFARSGNGGIRELAERVGRFAESGDLAEFGQLRYVFVRYYAVHAVTHVLTVTSLDRMPIEQMFPTESDAPGADLLDGVRPAHARRMLSARLEGSKHEMSLYETDRDPELALSSYDEPLHARGFTSGDLSAADGMNPVPTRVYFKQDDIVVVLAAPQDNHKTMVSAFRLANGGFASMRL
ncbi:MAG: hypothetical protein RL701_5801 [Pseudomonadota bacterium]